MNKLESNTEDIRNNVNNNCLSNNNSDNMSNEANLDVNNRSIDGKEILLDYDPMMDF